MLSRISSKLSENEKIQKVVSSRVYKRLFISFLILAGLLTVIGMYLLLYVCILHVIYIIIVTSILTDFFIQYQHGKYILKKEGTVRFCFFCKINTKKKKGGENSRKDN